MQKLTRAMIEAIHIIKTEKEYAKGLFKKISASPMPRDWSALTLPIRMLFPKSPTRRRMV